MKRFQFVTGFFCGALLFCGLVSGASAASGIMAYVSNQPIYVNGQRTYLTAYSISGNNFVKLRDIGRAVDFGVDYDPATNSVHISPDSPYIKEASAPAPAQTSPQTGPTEESVRAAIQGLRDLYPTLSYYPAPFRSTSGGPYGLAPSKCAGWATLCSDAAFGDLPWRRISSPSWDQIRPGDLVRFDTETSGHVIVVVDKTDEFLRTTESGRTNMVRWGGQYFRWWLEKQPGYTLYTRYPN